MTPSVNTRAHGDIDEEWDMEGEKQTSGYRITQTSKLLCKQCNREFPVCGIFSGRAENLLESCSSRLRHFWILPTGSGRPFIFQLFP